MQQVSPNTLKRLRLSSAHCLVLWVLVVSMVFLGAPFWSVLLVGVVGSFFAVRDWRIIRSLAREAVIPGHPDPGVHALIDGKIDVSDYRRRKE